MTQSNVMQQPAASEPLFDFANPEHARPMGLDYAPSAPEAHAFCETLGTVLMAAEAGRKNQRQNKRRHAFVLAAGAAVADLLKAAQSNPERWSSRSLKAETFTDADVSYSDFRSAMQVMEAMGFIERINGFYKRINWGDGESGHGRVTRFRATNKLIAFAADNGITPTNIDRLFKRTAPKLPTQVLVLKASSVRSGRQKIKGKPMRFEATDDTRRIEQDIRDLNRFLAERKIEGGIHRGYQRIFNQGDLEGHRFRKGGRIYSIGNDHYQTLNKLLRRKMTIDGIPVAEIDIRASHLTILHGIKGKPFDPSVDPYKSVPGLPRPVVKGWVTMTLGHTKRHTRWPKEKIEDLRRDGIDAKDYPVPEIERRILACLPVLNGWDKQPITCFDLMYLEAEAVIGAMLELMRVHQVPSLSVHDSLIVPVLAMELAEDVLSQHYQAVCGIKPELDTFVDPDAYEWKVRQWMLQNPDPSPTPLASF